MKSYFLTWLIIAILLMLYCILPIDFRKLLGADNIGMGLAISAISFLPGLLLLKED